MPPIRRPGSDRTLPLVPPLLKLRQPLDLRLPTSRHFGIRFPTRNHATSTDLHLPFSPVNHRSFLRRPRVPRFKNQRPLQFIPSPHDRHRHPFIGRLLPRLPNRPLRPFDCRKRCSFTPLTRIIARIRNIKLHSPRPKRKTKIKNNTTRKRHRNRYPGTTPNVSNSQPSRPKSWERSLSNVLLFLAGPGMRIRANRLLLTVFDPDSNRATHSLKSSQRHLHCGFKNAARTQAHACTEDREE